MKRYDLMQSINARGSFLLSRLCVPHLRKGSNSHVLTLSPPLSMDPKWFGQHPAYTMSKYGMSMVTLGFAERYREDGIAFNSLWPRTLIATAAVEFIVGGEAAMKVARTPEIMADAAHAILTSDSSNTGNFYIDDEVLLGAASTSPSTARRRKPTCRSTSSSSRASSRAPEPSLTKLGSRPSAGSARSSRRRPRRRRGGRGD